MTAAIDCGGGFRTWGCGCSHCLPRNHPLDLGARFTPEQLKAWGDQSGAIGRNVTRRCISCGSDRTRLYAGGWRCDAHRGSS